MNPETKGAIIGGVVAAVVSGVVTLGVNLYTDGISEQRQTERETILTFSEKGFPLTDLGSKYLAAVALKQPLDQIRESLRSQIAQEVSTVERYRQLPGINPKLIDDYQSALRDFSASLSTADSPIHMTAWATTFGKANDAYNLLDKTLRRRIGV